MKVVLVANARMPTEWAHGVQIVRMAEAFAGLGAQVLLLVPGVENPLKEDLFGFFGIRPSFRVRWLPVPGRLDGVAERLAFALAVAAAVRRHRPDLVLSRDELAGAAVASLVSGAAPTLVEVHKLPGRRLGLYAALLSRASGLISTNTWKAEALARLGLSPQRIRVLPNGTDVDGIAAASPRDLRAELSLPASARLVLYSGHLHAWKGVETLVQALPLLGPEVHVLLLGGRDKDIARFRRDHAHPRLHLLGRVRAAEVPHWLKGAELLVLPNVAISQESSQETSPLKLFEYMAAGRPIVASDLPAIREVLDEGTAMLVPPGDPRALAHSIEGLLRDGDRGRALAARALEAVQAHSWPRRAAAILAFARELGPGGHAPEAQG